MKPPIIEIKCPDCRSKLTEIEAPVTPWGTKSKKTPCHVCAVVWKATVTAEPVTEPRQAVLVPEITFEKQS